MLCTYFMINNSIHLLKIVRQENSQKKTHPKSSILIESIERRRKKLNGFVVLKIDIYCVYACIDSVSFRFNSIDLIICGVVTIFFHPFLFMQWMDIYFKMNRDILKYKRDKIDQNFCSVQHVVLCCVVVSFRFDWNDAQVEMWNGEFITHKKYVYDWNSFLSVTVILCILPQNDRLLLLAWITVVYIQHINIQHNNECVCVYVIA